MAGAVMKEYGAKLVEYTDVKSITISFTSSSHELFLLFSSFESEQAVNVLDCNIYRRFSWTR